MTEKNTHLKFPDLGKYAKSENLSKDVLIEAFELEKYYHSLLIKEENYERRLQIYNEFYTKLMPVYSRDNSQVEGQNPKKKYVKLFAREIENSSVIDYGCGQGFMLKSIDEQLNTKKLTGIDVYIPDDLKTHPRINFIESNIINHVTKEKYDVALSDNVLEHLVPEDARLHLESIFQNLKTGGKLIIIMPNRLFSPWDITRIKDFSQSGRLKAEGGHVNESTHIAMADQLKEIGFKKFSTILPIPKLKYILFRRFRIDIRWMKAVEKSTVLLKLIKSVRLRGECVLKFPVLIIAEK